MRASSLLTNGQSPWIQFVRVGLLLSDDGGGAVRFSLGSLFAAAIGCSVALAAPSERAEPAPIAGTETIGQALCRTIESAARANELPIAFFTKLIWQESSFRPHVVSPAGAQGIAQFMPQTANERGLADPFDPEQAIPEAARLLADHLHRFGNLGLAAAAYNGGPTRVQNWLDGRGGLPLETRDYVQIITQRSVEDWAKDLTQQTSESHPVPEEPQSCLQLAVELRRQNKESPGGGGEPLAPWGVQLAGNFSKTRALASYARASRGYARILGDLRPMIIGTRLRSRGTHAFYRVRVPAATRTAAIDLCNKIHASGGSCIVLRTWAGGSLSGQPRIHTLMLPDCASRYGLSADAAVLTVVAAVMVSLAARDLRVLHRDMVSPTSRSALVLGKAASSGACGLAQAQSMLFARSFSVLLRSGNAATRSACKTPMESHNSSAASIKWVVSRIEVPISARFAPVVRHDSALWWIKTDRGFIHEQHCGLMNHRLRNFKPSDTPPE
jgi:Transglycosylase SLT domain/SPOR domain